MVSHSKGVVALDLGRLATGYGMGAFSYVVIKHIELIYSLLSISYVIHVYIQSE